MFLSAGATSTSNAISIEHKSAKNVSNTALASKGFLNCCVMLPSCTKQFLIFQIKRFPVLAA